MDEWHQAVCKKCKRVEDSNTNIKNIQSGHRNGILHWKICLANNEKWIGTNKGRNRTIKSRKNHNACRKENLQVLGNIGSGHHQISGNERKNKANKKPSSIARISSKG